MIIIVVVIPQTRVPLIPRQSLFQLLRKGMSLAYKTGTPLIEIYQRQLELKVAEISLLLPVCLIFILFIFILFIFSGL
jgi:hypothetical protein